MRTMVSVGLLALALAGCSKATQTDQMAAFSVEEPTTAPAPDTATAPQIAYTYTLSYRVEGAAIAGVQQRQAALCARLGPIRCRVASSSITDAGHAAASGNTRLLIDARIAQPFIRKLDAVVGDAGGDVGSRQTNAEDVTKQIIDTEARLRAKQALADRLMRLIQTADGKVGDLVAAEKAFADVQEELDAARSTQAALRQRVAMSDVTIDYTATEATGIASPVTASLRNAGVTLGTSAATLVTFGVGALPWLVVLAVAIWLIRRTRWRPRLPRRHAPYAGDGGGTMAR